MRRMLEFLHRCAKISRIGSLSLEALVAILISLGGCGKDDLTAPLDGIWLLTGITCNGAPATGTLASALDAQPTFVLTGSSAVYSYLTSATCIVSIPATSSYPSHSTFTYTAYGTQQCSPASCTGACGTAATGGATYSFTVTGLNTMKWTSSTDTACSTANPVQADPVEYIFTRQ